MRRNVEHHFGAYLVNGELVQTDWDYPATACDLGWSLTRVQKRNRETVELKRRPSRVALGTVRAGHVRNCAHLSTDGTVTCSECGITAGEFISAAASYLNSLAW